MAEKNTSKGTRTARKRETEGNQLVREADNRAEVASRHLPAETIVKTVNRVQKHGKKVILSTVTIEKAKRPSKLLRKARRAEARKALGHEIEALEAKIEATPEVLPLADRVDAALAADLSMSRTGFIGKQPRKRAAKTDPVSLAAKERLEQVAQHPAGKGRKPKAGAEISIDGL